MRLPAGYCGLFLFALLLAIGFGGVQIFGDPDTAWHIAAGDLIRETHAIPFTDPWSYASAGEIWYNLSWLFDVGFSALFGIGGFTALYVVTLLAFAGSFIAMAHLCIKRGASISAVSIMLFLALLVSFTSILARPNLISVPFTVAVYYWLSRYRDGGKASGLWPIPVVMALWANMHGGFLLAFPIMGAFAFEALVTGNRKALRAYGILIALSIAATTLNPWGYGVYFGAYKTLSWGYDKQYVVEWQPVKIGKDIPMTLVLITMLFVGNLRDRTIALSDRLLSFGLIFMALSSMRHGVVAATLTMPYLSQRITSVLRESSFAAKLARRESAIMADMQKNDVKWMGVIMACVGVALLASPFPRDMFLKEPLGFPKKNYPLAEAEFIERKYPHVRFMTDYNIGGWLDFIWRGRVKTFVDGRASSLFSKEVLQDYADFEFEGRGYGAKARLIANQYGFEGAIIPNDDAAAADWHWNPDWRLIYQGEAASIYLKASLPIARGVVTEHQAPTKK